MKLIIFSLLYFIVPILANAQISIIKIVVPSNIKATDGVFNFRLHSNSFACSIPYNKDLTTINIPYLDSTTKISIEYISKDLPSTKWEGSFKFIGSDKSELILKEGGDFSIFQWPKVEIQNAASKAEIFVNGESWGDTYLSRTIQPNIEHSIQWVKAGKVTCIKTIKLSYNQKRRFTCNSDNTITED